MRYFKEYLYQVFESRLTKQTVIPKEYQLNHVVSSFAETTRSPQDFFFYFDYKKIASLSILLTQSGELFFLWVSIVK